MIINDWTPIGVGLPDDDTLVLVALSDDEVWPGFLDGTTWRYVDATPIESACVTHWTNMPPAPTKEAA